MTLPKLNAFVDSELADGDLQVVSAGGQLSGRKHGASWPQPTINLNVGFNFTESSIQRDGNVVAGRDAWIFG